MKTKKLAGILSAAVLASSCTSAIACQTASAKELSSASIAYDINTPAADVTGTAYAKTAEGFVQRMYNVALNRNADAAGLKNWTSQLKSGKKTAVPALLLKAAGTAVFIIHVCKQEVMEGKYVHFFPHTVMTVKPVQSGNLSFYLTIPILPSGGLRGSSPR